MNDAPISDECVGCGYCCKKAPCVQALLIDNGVQPPCPLLVLKDGRYWCQIVLDEPPDSELRREMAIGAGCSSPMFNNDRENMIRYKSVLTSS